MAIAVEEMTGNLNITREQYIENIKKNRDYASFMEISALANSFNIRIAIYMKDERYSNKRWTLIKGNDGESLNQSKTFFFLFLGTGFFGMTYRTLQYTQN